MPTPDTLYQRQLNSVEDLLAVHPEFLNALSPEEQPVFRRYFLPNWDETSDYADYRRDLLEREPRIEEDAQRLLLKFLQAHGIDPGYLLPPPA